jgi:DNA-binding beta-propeller fold protein YncE
MIESAPKLFICYRREETAAHAGRLYDAIAVRFGERNVFMDIELEPGIDFVDRIGEVVGACHVFLVVVGPTWATLPNGGSRPRLTDREDFVRLEVETALRRRDVRVIPLLVAGARMPHSEELPEELRGLCRRNALELSDLRWRYDVGRLMGTLEELLETAAVHVPAGAKATEEPSRAPAPVEPVATVPAAQADAGVVEPAERGERPEQPPVVAKGQRPSRRGWLLAAAGAAAALLLAGLAIAGVFGGGDEADGGGGGGGGGAGGGAPRVSATIPLGGGPDGLAVDGDEVWVTDQEKDVVRRVDVGSNQPTGEPIPVGQNPDGVAAEDGTAWVANIDDGTVTRLNTSDDGAVTNEGTVTLGGQPEGIALGKQLVWVTTGPEGTVRRIDRAQATALNPPIDIGSNTIDAFVGKDGVYVSDKAANTVTLVDSDSAEVSAGPIQVGNTPRGLVEGEGSVWVANSGDDTVSRIAASTERLVGSPINVGDNPRDVAFLGGFVWVVNTDSGTVTRIDASNGEVVGKAIRVGEKPASIEAGAGSVWVSNSGDGTLSRIEL